MNDDLKRINLKKKSLNLMSTVADRNEGSKFECRCFETKYEIVYGFICWCVVNKRCWSIDDLPL